MAEAFVFKPPALGIGFEGPPKRIVSGREPGLTGKRIGFPVRATPGLMSRSAPLANPEPDNKVEAGNVPRMTECVVKEAVVTASGILDPRVPHGSTREAE